jgi:hypothetical protein
VFIGNEFLFNVSFLESSLAPGPCGKGGSTIVGFGVGCRRRLLLELFCEGFIIEESPRIVELVVPCPLEVVHGLDHVINLLVPHQCQQGRINPLGVFRIGCISFGGAY